MAEILHYGFLYKTPDTTGNSKSLENFIYITEKDEVKHYIQYIQYYLEYKNNQKYLNLRKIDIKVDRSYYLEIANVSISDRTREKHLFSVLGKRRFGANSKRFDCYFQTDKLSEGILFEYYNKFYEFSEHKPLYTDRANNSVNSYQVFTVTIEKKNIVFLDQLNISSRKKLHKTYVVELDKEKLQEFEQIDIAKKKIDFVFNIIGKHHFKSLPLITLDITNDSESVEQIVKEQLNKNIAKMESASSINSNSTYRSLKKNYQENKKIISDLYSISNSLMTHNHDEAIIERFSIDVVKFSNAIKDIVKLENIATYFTTIQMIAAAGTIEYLFTKSDPDFKDIYLYMLESMNVWHDLFIDSEENIREFNIATIDFQDSLRHLVDICFKFKHEYQCKEVHSEIEVKEEIIFEESNFSKTSAKDYFNEVELESDSYDELNELEDEIASMQHLKIYNSALNESFVRFFDGYVRVLNPLFEFQDLSYSLMVLSQKLKEFEVDEENSQMLIVLINALIIDLHEWKKTVLVEQSAEDIHYMNKSFYSNISQIEILLENRDEEIFDDSDIFF